MMTEYDEIGGAGIVFEAAAEIENVIVVVFDNVTMNEDPDEKTNASSNLTNAGGRSYGDANTQVQVHEFVSDRQMHNWRC